jgi:hypothetical protein
MQKISKTQAFTIMFISYFIFKKPLNRIKKAKKGLAKINPEFRKIHKAA